MVGSDEEPPEYEVESVLEARAEAQRRPKKLTWKFRVRWKGYSSDDDTWEPIESFDGSEHIVATFWERTNTNGRDINDLTLFQAGETFLPLGPPRHKLKRKSSHKTITMPPSEDVQPIKSKSATPPSSKFSEKRRHTDSEPSGVISERPSKRPREDNSRPTQSSPLVPERSRDIRGGKRPRQIILSPTPSPSKKNPRRIDSEEVIPDSDEETKGPATTNLIYPSIFEEAKQASGSTALSKSLHTFDHEEDDFHPLFDEEPIERVPTLRDRLIEPRVKMIDDPKLSNIEGAILAKTNAVARLNADPSSSKSNVLTSDSQKSDRRHSKPGPGRSSMGLKVKNVSSLLTFSKGSLKTVKGKYVKEASRAHTDLTFRDDPPDIMEVDAISENLPPAPPTAEELLRLAGFNNEIASDLPDYEDNPLQDIQPNLSEAAEPVAPESVAPGSVAPGSVAPESVAPGFVAPTTASENVNDKESSSLPWESIEVAKEKLFPTEALSNVFGTLANKWKRHTIFGPLGLGSELPATPEQLRTSQLYLNLDSSVSIPLVLLEPSNSLDVQIGSKGPSGKFYHMQAALALLGTLRASGTSAIVVVGEDGSREDRDHFLRFSERLEGGDIFVAISGVQILVFCSTTATLVSQRLNAPTVFLNEPGKILVSLVSIENYTGYADAAVDADDRRWSQYIAEH